MAEYNALNREIIGELLTDLEIEVDLAKKWSPGGGKGEKMPAGTYQRICA